MGAYLRVSLSLVLLSAVLMVGLVMGDSHPHPHPPLLEARRLSLHLTADSSPNTAPTVKGFNTLLGTPGQWLYVSGSGFEKEGNTTLYFTSLSGQEVVYGPLTPHVYQDDSMGFTIPKDCPATFVRLQVVTHRGGKSEPSADPLVIATPINPPSVRDFSSYSGGTGCWLYVNGESFVVGQTEVHIGGVLPTSMVVYSSQSIGLTVPTLLGCSKEPVTVSVKTPNGQATSTKTYTIVPGKSGGFC